MEPLSATVTAIVTGFLVKGAAAVTAEVGEAAANAARTLAQAVLDRLKADPDEKRNAERYEEQPEAIQPTIKVILDGLVEADAEFAAKLQGLVDTYQSTAAISVNARDIGRNLIIGDQNQVIDGNTGTINIGGGTKPG
jgi:hypothetical protein